MGKTKGQRTCVICKKQMPKEEAIDVKGRAYCPDCAPPPDKEAESYRMLYDYLKKLCDGEDELVGYLLTQVKRIKNTVECDYKYSGILATLKYVFELSEHPPVFNPKYGIETIVIKNYYWARKYYEQKRELEKQDVNTIDEILQTPEVEVHISQDMMEYQRQLFLNKHKDKLYGPIIDLDSIEDEEDIDAEV